MQKLILIFLLASFSLSANAQKSKKDRKDEKRQRINALIKQEEEGVIAYSRHTVFGGKLTNDGYGFLMELGRATSIKYATLFQLDIAERKHPKEAKQTLTGLPITTNPYIYGKINFVYDVKLGVQKQMLMANKSNKNGVSITGNLGGGINLGLLRPYYVQVLGDVSTKFVKYHSADSALFLNDNVIIGGPGLSKGWSDINLNPALYAKASVRFDYGRYNETVSALEIGANADFYSKKLVQMVYIKPKQLFFNVYVALIFGKRNK